jgi:hypothetical protein
MGEKKKTDQIDKEPGVLSSVDNLLEGFEEQFHAALEAVAVGRERAEAVVYPSLERAYQIHERLLAEKGEDGWKSGCVTRA